MTRLPSSSQVTDQGLAANKLPGPASASSTSLSRCSILGWGSTVPKRSLVGQRLSGRDGPLLIIRVDGSLATESGPCPRAQEDHVLASSWTTLTRWKVLGIQTITMCAKVTQAHHAPRLPWARGFLTKGYWYLKGQTQATTGRPCPNTPGRGAQPLTTVHVRWTSLISGCMVTQHT